MLFTIMRKAIIFLMTVLLADSMSGQTFDRSNFMVNDPDTVVLIPSNSRVAYCSSVKSQYSLRLYVDQSAYELFVVDAESELILCHTISWGDYKAQDDKIFFCDRVAGFKMVASLTSDGLRFSQDYFPDIDKDVWKILPAESRDGGVLPLLSAVFDRHKARHFRDSYIKRYKEPFEFTPNIYYSNMVLNIGDDGKWEHKHGNLVLAEGEWHRKGNILVLKCPKLKCKFHVAIGDNKLVSMLLLGDTFGRYYFNKAQQDKLLGR